MGEVSDVVLVVGEDAASVDLNAQLPVVVLLAHLHTHPLVKVVDVLLVDALLEWLVLLPATERFGAIAVVV